MPDSYYPEDSPSEPSGKDGGASESPATDTALIPKALLAGKDFKVGDEVVFKIEHMYEDEVEIAYATEEKKPDSKSAMSESEDSLNEMAGMKE